MTGEDHIRGLISSESAIIPTLQSPVIAPPILRDGRITDAATIEAVHYASREAAYRDRVSDWPPQGLDRPGRVARWERWLSDPVIEAIVAEVGGEIVGFCTLRPSPDEPHEASNGAGAVAEMPTLYVDPGHFRQGLGRALCDAGVDRARSLGFSELTLWVLEVNENARGFYEAYGFTADGARKVDELTVDKLVAHRYRLDLRRQPKG